MDKIKDPGSKCCTILKIKKEYKQEGNERKGKKIEEKKGKKENIYRRKNWTFHFDRCPGRVKEFKMENMVNRVKCWKAG